MEQVIRLQYINERLKIGLVNWKEAWLLTGQPVHLNTEVYKGNLVFRVPGSSKRISYQQVKTGLVKKVILIKEEIPF